MTGYRFMDGITEYRKDRTTEGQGESSIAPLFQSGAIIRLQNKTVLTSAKMLTKRSVPENIVWHCAAGIIDISTGLHTSGNLSRFKMCTHSTSLGHTD